MLLFCHVAYLVATRVKLGQRMRKTLALLEIAVVSDY
jgi:hypothetical protein